MKNRLVAGTRRIGHVLDEDGNQSHVALLELDHHGATISQPVVDQSMTDLALRINNRNGTPKTLRFADHNGHVVLAECFPANSSYNFNGRSLVAIGSPRVIATEGAMADYSSVQGLQSRIDGLARWIEMSTVHLEFQHGPPSPMSLSLRAQNHEPRLLGGPLNAAVLTEFWHTPDPHCTEHTIRDLLSFRTTSADLRSWNDHARQHGMMQDLMCLVFGKPCHAELVKAMREDDQPDEVDLSASPRYWNDVYEPGFGRSSADRMALDRVHDRPLFLLDDVQPSAFETWLSQWERWSRPTWIAVTTMFQSHTNVEAKLIQIGVALEALGYALWSEEVGDVERRPPSFPQLLQRVQESTGVESRAIYGNLAPGEWRKEFNDAFKGAKHADNPLPEGRVARLLSDQGLTLIRAWLASKLGVQADLIHKGLGKT